MLYLNRKNKTIIEPELVKTLLSYVGFKIEDIQRTNLIYTNDVYKFIQKGIEYYAKFFTDQWCDENNGYREIKILDLLRQKGIPVTNSIYFGNANNKSPRNFAIYEKIDGIPLIKTLPRRLPIKLIKESIKLLKKISNIRGEYGFFLHDPNIHKTYPTHFDFINDTVAYSFKKLRDFGYEIYNIPTLFEKCRKKDIRIRNFSLCHNDFTPKHIFVNKWDKIVGLIDFEWAVYSSPISDGALWLTSLAEYGQDIKTLELIVNYCSKLENFELFSYFVARKLILAASWPHKNIKQPYYSQTCLDKAKSILSRREFNLENVIWKGELGVETLEDES